MERGKLLVVGYLLPLRLRVITTLQAPIRLMTLLIFTLIIRKSTGTWVTIPILRCMVLERLPHWNMRPLLIQVQRSPGLSALAVLTRIQQPN